MFGSPTGRRSARRTSPSARLPSARFPSSESLPCELLPPPSRRPRRPRRPRHYRRCRRCPCASPFVWPPAPSSRRVTGQRVARGRARSAPPVRRSQRCGRPAPRPPACFRRRGWTTRTSACRASPRASGCSRVPPCGGWPHGPSGRRRRMVCCGRRCSTSSTSTSSSATPRSSTRAWITAPARSDSASPRCPRRPCGRCPRRRAGPSSARSSASAARGSPEWWRTRAPRSRHPRCAASPSGTACPSSCSRLGGPHATARCSPSGRCRR